MGRSATPQSRRKRGASQLGPERVLARKEEAKKRTKADLTAFLKKHGVTLPTSPTKDQLVQMVVDLQGSMVAESPKKPKVFSTPTKTAGPSEFISPHLAAMLKKTSYNKVKKGSPAPSSSSKSTPSRPNPFQRSSQTPPKSLSPVSTPTPPRTSITAIDTAPATREDPKPNRAVRPPRASLKDVGVPFPTALSPHRRPSLVSQLRRDLGHRRTLWFLLAAFLLAGALRILLTDNRVLYRSKVVFCDSADSRAVGEARVTTDCVQCPEHGRCAYRRLIDCEPGFQVHMDACVLRGEVLQLTTAMTREAIAFLDSQAGKAECGTSESAFISRMALRNHVQHHFGDNVHFERALTRVMEELPRLTASLQYSHSNGFRSLRPRISWSCFLRTLGSTTIAPAAVTFLVIGAPYLVYRRRQRYQEHVSAALGIVMRRMQHRQGLGRASDSIPLEYLEHEVFEELGTKPDPAVWRAVRLRLESHPRFSYMERMVDGVQMTCLKYSTFAQ